MANIGDEIETIEVEPLPAVVPEVEDVPETAPVEEPVPA